jgi:hypothetical protein
VERPKKVLGLSTYLTLDLDSGNFDRIIDFIVVDKFRTLVTLAVSEKKSNFFTYISGILGPIQN